MIRIALLALAALVGLLGCSENSLNPWDGVNGASPRIEVSPPLLDYGVLRQGEDLVQTFTITNTGGGDLEIQAIRLDADASFSQLTFMEHFLLPPGSSQEIDVRFEPLGSHEQVGAGFVLSNDPTLEVAQVDLVGFGAVPELQIRPGTFDFGTKYVGCGAEKEVVLANVGTDTLRITNLAYSELMGMLTLDEDLDLPLALEPGEEVPVWVDFMPSTQAGVSGTLTVTSNDPRGAVSATQTGRGTYAAWIEEDFVVPANPPVDILFAVDQSCSMDGHAAALSSSFSGLIGAIQAVTSGWRIGVATLDSGCFNHGALQSTTPSLLTKFGEAVIWRTGGTLGNTEKLFLVAQDALSKTASGQCNAGFLRPDAMLHVVLVSDEREQSGVAAATFVQNIAAYKASSAQVKVSGMICPPAGCAGIADGTDAGYAQAVSLTGGVRGDVMATNWSGHAAAIAQASLEGINRYELTQNADPNSVLVWVNGQQWLSGWHFEPSSNEVVFESNPPANALIEVSYGALVNCPT